MSTEYLDDETVNNNNNYKILSTDTVKSLGNIGLDSIMIAFALVITLFMYSILKHFMNKIFDEENNLIAKFVVMIILIAVFIFLCKYYKKTNF